MTKPLIIFTSPILQYPPIGGPRLRIANSIKALAQVADLIIYSRTSQANVGGEKGVKYFKRYAKEIHFAPSVDPDKKSIFKGRLSTLADFFDLVKLAKKNNVKTIWLGYGNISYGLAILLKLFSPFKVVIDTDSVWSRFVFRSLPFAKSKKDKVKKIAAGVKKRIQEYLGTKLADVTTGVSELDANYYKKFAKSKRKVAVFSNVIDLNDYRRETQPAVDIKKPSVYLAGSYGPGSPMEEAAIWIIEKVLPLVWQKLPSLHFYIVGRGSTKKLAIHKNDRIVITGEVPSVLPYLKNVDAVLVPLKFESGTRFKILEAAACNTPIISTKLGAEGLNVTDDQDILLADSPKEFAHAIVRLVEDGNLKERLVKNAYQNIASKYDLNRAEKEARSILEYLTV